MPDPPPAGSYTTARSKFAGLPELTETIAPKDCGQLAGFVACRVRHANPAGLVRLIKPVVLSRTTPAVCGFPSSPIATSAIGTACVSGLSGSSGRKRTGNGVGNNSRQRSAAGSGGKKIVGAGTVPRLIPVKVNP